MNDIVQYTRSINGLSSSWLQLSINVQTAFATINNATEKTQQLVDGLNVSVTKLVGSFTELSKPRFITMQMPSAVLSETHTSAKNVNNTSSGNRETSGEGFWQKIPDQAISATIETLLDAGINYTKGKFLSSVAKKVIPNMFKTIAVEGLASLATETVTANSFATLGESLMALGGVTSETGFGLIPLITGAAMTGGTYLYSKFRQSKGTAQTSGNELVSTYKMVLESKKQADMVVSSNENMTVGHIHDDKDAIDKMKQMASMNDVIQKGWKSINDNNVLKATLHVVDRLGYQKPIYKEVNIASFIRSLDKVPDFIRPASAAVDNTFSNSYQKNVDAWSRIYEAKNEGGRNRSDPANFPFIFPHRQVSPFLPVADNSSQNNDSYLPEETATNRSGTTIYFTKPLIENFTINVKDMKEGVEELKQLITTTVIDVLQRSLN